MKTMTVLVLLKQDYYKPTTLYRFTYEPCAKTGLDLLTLMLTWFSNADIVPKNTRSRQLKGRNKHHN